MFADDPNFFLSDKNVKNLFSRMNVELDKFNIWFKANKFSLNSDKTNFTLFHKTSLSDDLPLKLPQLTMNNESINRKVSLKFLGVLIDECLKWKEHIKVIETKPANTHRFTLQISSIFKSNLSS